MSRASVAELRRLDTDRLAELYSAGHVDVGTLLAIDRADVAADRARARAAVERAAWLDAAHAQYLDADSACAGRLLARGTNLADALSLWRGSEAWARGQASEELCNYWDVHGRLSLAEYRRQQSLQRRVARDERDLAAMGRPAPARPPAPRKATPAPAPERRPMPERRAPGPIARYITALDQLTARLQRFDQLAARIAARPIPGGNRP